MQSPAKKLHAVLIGIDDYRSSRYKPLRGAVNDVVALRSCLQEICGVPPQNLQVLTAPRSAGDAARASPSWPSYENLTAAIRGLGAGAESGDQGLIYFSGHGGRFPTKIPQVRGEDGLDKALIPADVDDDQAPGLPLRDVELAYLIEELAGAGLRITLLLDCCHSGGPLRAAEPAGGRRRGGQVDLRPRAAGTVASPAKLTELWRRLRRQRDAEVWSGWRLPSKTVVGAACQAHEVAYERRIGGQARGLFTFWWVDSLERRGPSQTYREIQDRAIGKVRGLQDGQRPVLEGDADRLVFGDARRPAGRGVTVLAVDEQTRDVALDGGRVHGLEPGAVLRLELGDASPTLLRLGEDVDGTLSRARPVADSMRLPEAGDQVRVVDPGPSIRRRRVAVGGGAAAVLGDGAVDQLRAVLTGSGFLDASAGAADFVIRRSQGSLAVTDAEGRRLLALGDSPAAPEIAGRVEHLARYLLIQELENPARESQLTGLVRLKLVRPPAGWRHPQPIAAGRGREIASPAMLGDGEVVWLAVENGSRNRVHYAILDLRPDWSCVRLVPRDGDSRGLAAGRTEAFPLSPRFEPGDRPCRDILKLLVSLEATDFGWLELPVPGEAGPAAQVRPVTRRVPAPLTSTAWLYWTTHQAVFEVRPPGNPA